MQRRIGIVGLLAAAAYVTPAAAQVLSCDELLQMLQDRASWASRLQSAPRQIGGWSIKVDVLVVGSSDAKTVVASTETEQTLSAAVEANDRVGGRVMPSDVSDGRRSLSPIPFFVRIIARKPVFAESDDPRCGIERRGAAPREMVVARQLQADAELDNTYWIIAYDERKRILSEGEIIVRPKGKALAESSKVNPPPETPRGNASAPATNPANSENEAGLRVAIKSLELCNAHCVFGAIRMLLRSARERSSWSCFSVLTREGGPSPLSVVPSVTAVVPGDTQAPEAS